MKMDVYRDVRDGEWHFRIVTINGREVACSKHGYKRKNACEKVAAAVAAGCDYMSVES